MDCFCLGNLVSKIWWSDRDLVVLRFDGMGWRSGSVRSVKSSDDWRSGWGETSIGRLVFLLNGV